MQVSSLVCYVNLNNQVLSKADLVLSRLKTEFISEEKAFKRSAVVLETTTHSGCHHRTEQISRKRGKTRVKHRCKQ